MRAVFGGSWIMGIISASTTARKGIVGEDGEGVMVV
jgi:hypothetical protein